VLTWRWYVCLGVSWEEISIDCPPHGLLGRHICRDLGRSNLLQESLEPLCGLVIVPKAMVTFRRLSQVLREQSTRVKGLSAARTLDWQDMAAINMLSEHIVSLTTNNVQSDLPETVDRRPP
jgi:hypothetical protein